MTRALAALLTRAIDYAGVFPPAKLDLATALQKYIRYRTGPEAWALGKFVVRVSQLAELAVLLKESKPSIPLAITVIGRGGADRQAWESALESDAKDLNAFQREAGDFGTLEGYEVRLPNNSQAAAWIADLHGFDEVDIYTEMSLDAELSDALAAAAEAEFVRAKVRTGGETAAAFPSADRLAAFLQGAVQLAVPFKCTAGLHHATPHFEQDIGVRMHGFINVLAATAFAAAHDLTVREIASVLNADAPGAFSISELGLAGLGWEVEHSQLAEARELFVAFGSCSVSEPLDALRAAGYQID